MEKTIDVYGVPMDIEYEQEKFTPGVMNLPNGDPGYPDEGGEITLTSVSIEGHDVMKLLSDITLRHIEELIGMEVSQDDYEPDYDEDRYREDFEFLE